MTRRTGFMESLQAGGFQMGTFVKTPAPEFVEILALAGLDFVCLDLEHSPFGVREMDQCLGLARALDLPAIVRLCPPLDGMLQHALDGGAAGVLVPHVDSVEAAQQVARLARFGPGGSGYSGSTRSAGFTVAGPRQPAGCRSNRPDRGHWGRRGGRGNRPGRGNRRAVLRGGGSRHGDGIEAGRPRNPGCARARKTRLHSGGKAVQLFLRLDRSGAETSQREGRWPRSRALRPEPAARRCTRFDGNRTGAGGIARFHAVGPFPTSGRCAETASDLFHWRLDALRRDYCR